jgi:L-iditol 2-dehydrogenase
MQAVRIYGKLDMRLDEVPDPPDPGPGEVLLRPTAVGVCGSDTHRYLEGGIGKRVITPDKPLVPGHEFAAVVEKVGPGVTFVRPGDRVAVEPARSCGHCELCLLGKRHLCLNLAMCGSNADGALRERILYPADEEFLIPLPDSVSDEEGALLEPLGVAMHSLELHRLRLADTVAVLGAGTIGLLITQLAKLAGASQIIVSDPLEYRLEAAKEMGATDVLNPRKVDAVKAVQDLTRGRGVDVVYEASGSTEALKQGVEMARPGGTYILVGLPVPDMVELPFTAAWQRELTVIFQKRMNDIYPRALKMLTRGMVRLLPLVTHRFSLDQAVQAFETAGRYRDGVLKAVIRVNP